MPEVSEDYGSGEAKRRPGRPPKNRRAQGDGIHRGGDSEGAGGTEDVDEIKALLIDMRRLLEYTAFKLSNTPLELDEWLERYVYAGKGEFYAASARGKSASEDNEEWQEDQTGVFEG